MSNWPVDGYANEEIKYDVVDTHKVLGDVFTIPFGYIFDGWNTLADGTGISYIDEQLISITENLTLYAQWKKINTNVDNMIRSVELGTKVSDIENMIGVSGDYNVFDKDDNLIDDTSVRLKTGDKIKITLSDDTLIYVVSVNGDINGDGFITKDDVLLASKHLVKDNVVSGIPYLDALDIDDNDIYNINDIIKMFKIVKGE